MVSSNLGDIKYFQRLQATNANINTDGIFPKEFAGIYTTGSDHLPYELYIKTEFTADGYTTSDFYEFDDYKTIISENDPLTQLIKIGDNSYTFTRIYPEGRTFPGIVAFTFNISRTFIYFSDDGNSILTNTMYTTHEPSFNIDENVVNTWEKLGYNLDGQTITTRLFRRNKNV